MTTREAEVLLRGAPTKTDRSGNITAKPERRRVEATYCPICAGWVEVRLNPVRLRCTGCGIEARP